MAEKNEKKRKPNFIQKIKRFFRETSGELHKVNWPTPKEAWNLTKIVLIVLAAMSFALGSLDFIFSWVLTRLLA